VLAIQTLRADHRGAQSARIESVFDQILVRQENVNLAITCNLALTLNASNFAFNTEALNLL
jgi:hypothetical protein